MDFVKVEKLIGLMLQYDLNELKVAEKDWEFSARRGEKAHAPSAVAAPVQAAIQSAAETAASAPKPPGGKEITAPIVGTFYRSPAPDQAPFKEIGDSISVGDVVCIVEAMKVMNEIKSEVSGKLLKILVENSSAVEYGQPLFLVEAGS